MSITEVIGVEGSNVVLEEIFRFQSTHDGANKGKVQGNFVTSGLMQRSVLVEKSKFFGLENELKAVFTPQGVN